MNKLKTVKGFYNAKLWSEKMVWNAVDRWITEKEYLDITGNKYKKA
ncbi:XkdX family protein [Lacrimispora sp.]|nr:XkdX family protein [Lacrimispora sp.]